MDEPRDAFGLTDDDWRSFFNPGPQHFTGPAMLFWTLAGGAGEQGVLSMNRTPLPNLLDAIALDARALATLARSARTDDIKALAPLLEGLYRRIATAAEISRRKQELEQDEKRGDPPPSPAQPGPNPPARPSGC